MNSADPYASSIGHVPSGAWQFDEKVTEVFDDMLARSIPQLDVMRDAVQKIGASFVQPGTDVVDLGCSRGNAIAPFIDRFGSANTYRLIDSSLPMVNVCESRFAAQIESGEVSTHHTDLRDGLPTFQASLVLSVLTMQFVPIDARSQIVQSVYDSLVPGGAFIVVEKVLGSSAQTHCLFRDLYWDLKRSNGYSEKEIQAKARSLDGVLVPVEASWNESLLRTAGFSRIDCFYRWLNFAGWVAIKT